MCQGVDRTCTIALVSRGRPSVKESERDSVGDFVGEDRALLDAQRLQQVHREHPVASADPNGGARKGVLGDKPIGSTQAHTESPGRRSQVDTDRKVEDLAEGKSRFHGAAHPLPPTRRREILAT
ncbi:hypothetical protein GPN2_21800 [Streptomyces murinus]